MIIKDDDMIRCFSTNSDKLDDLPEIDILNHDWFIDKLKFLNYNPREFHRIIYIAYDCLSHNIVGFVATIRNNENPIDQYFDTLSEQDIRKVQKALRIYMKLDNLSY